MNISLFSILGFAAALLTVYKLRSRSFMQTPGISILVSLGVFIGMNMLFGALEHLFAANGVRTRFPILPVLLGTATLVGGFFLVKRIRNSGWPSLRLPTLPSILESTRARVFAFLLGYAAISSIVIVVIHHLKGTPWSDLIAFSFLGLLCCGFIAMVINGIMVGIETRRLGAQGVPMYRGLPITAESYEAMGVRPPFQPRTVDTKKNGKVTFADVGGCTEAKVELEEIIDFLKNPQQFSDFGGRPPKGILLTGDPGNGKTLLAKAVAGEAGVPFYEMAGSDFVEKFVGVGPSRIRDTFSKAGKDPAAIIFIDELDALAAARSADGTGNREYENTLNAFLVEMDGMSSTSNVIVMGATNRPDILDSAVVRPGRFDRTIEVDKPDLAGRIQIFKIHMANKPLAPDVDINILADRTAGYSGAEIMSACNESAIMGARRYKTAVEKANKSGLSAAAIRDIPKVISLRDCDEGLDRAKYGPASESRARAMTAEDKANSTWHELGHAVIAQHFGQAVEKITILPRGKAAAYVLSSPTKGGQATSYDEKQLRGRICMLLGGRLATEIFLGQKDTGPVDDLTQVNKLARAMVVDYGMSEEVGLISSCTQGASRGNRTAATFGPTMLDEIDKAVRKLIAECKTEARELLEKTHRGRMENLFSVLLKKETLVGPEWKSAWDAAGTATEATAA